MYSIILNLKKAFEKYSENCSIIIAPTINERYGSLKIECYPDAIVVKDNVFCLIEMKAFSGDIIADCSGPDAPWISKTEDELKSGKKGRNPYYQAKNHRESLVEFIARHLNKDQQSSNDSENVKIGGIPTQVRSWVVLLEGATPTITGIYPQKTPWFDVLPLDKLARNMIYFKKRAVFSPKQFEDFIVTLGASKVSVEEWYRGERLERTNEALEPIPQIKKWITSEKHDEISKALQYIRELRLEQHRADVINCWHNSKDAQIRQLALIILIEFQSMGLETFLSEALLDQSEYIGGFTLDYLAKNRYPKTFPTLSKLLLNGSKYKDAAVVKALSSTGEPDAGNLVFNYAQDSFKSRPFQKFQFLDKRVDEYLAGKLSNSEVEELFTLEREEAALYERLKVVLEALGELKVQKSIPWTLNFLKKPTELGFESDDYSTLEMTGFRGVFEDACNSIAKLGENDEKVAEFFLEKLGAESENIQEIVVIALGNLSTKSTAGALFPFLKKRDSNVSSLTISALSKIGAKEAFEPLAEFYLTNSDYEYTNIVDALKKIDSERFANILCQQISSKRVSVKRKQKYMRTLLPVVNVKCANALFPLLKNRQLSYMASWNLSLLSEKDEIRKKADELTESNDPVEKAAAINILSKYFVEDPGELARFETPDSPVEVRRIVADLLLGSRSKDKLLKYAKDPDSSVRESLFLSYFKDRFFGEKYLVMKGRRVSKCQLCTDEETLVIKRHREVVVIPKTQIQYAFASKHNHYSGVYLRTTSDNLREPFLLVPTRDYLDEDYFAKEFIPELKVNAKTDLADAEDEQVNRLWTKVLHIIKKEE
jgi:HEAT repeat protein